MLSSRTVALRLKLQQGQWNGLARMPSPLRPACLHSCPRPLLFIKGVQGRRAEASGSAGHFFADKKPQFSRRLTPRPRPSFSGVSEHTPPRPRSTAANSVLLPLPVQMTKVGHRVSALEGQQFLIIHATADGEGGGVAPWGPGEGHTPMAFWVWRNMLLFLLFFQQKRSTSSTRQNSSHSSSRERLITACR